MFRGPCTHGECLGDRVFIVFRGPCIHGECLGDWTVYSWGCLGDRVFIVECVGDCVFIEGGV